MATSALSQNVNMAANLAQLATALFGGGDTTTTKSGGTSTATATSTKKTDISQAGLQALIQGMLEDQSTGLARVASGARQSGLYNTSTQQLLINDLISRASNQAALASAPTTTSTTETRTEQPTTQVTKQAGMLNGSGGMGNMLLPALGLGMLMKKGSGDKSMFDSLSEAVGGFFGGDAGGDSGTAVGSVVTDAMFSPFIGSLTGLGGNFASDNTEIGSLSDIVSSAIGIDTSGSSGLLDGISGGLGDVGNMIVDIGGGIADFFKDTSDDIFEEIGSWF